MRQLSMFDLFPVFPETYDDVEGLLDQIREGETDADLFSFKETSHGRSYSFYGTKVFEFRPRKSARSQSVMKVSTDILAALGQATGAEKKGAYTSVVISGPEEMPRLIDALKSRKRTIFRNMISETFACCNDFCRCSDAKACIHRQDRFYNGCAYRTNLENGRIFYGKNRNID